MPHDLGHVGGVFFFHAVYSALANHILQSHSDSYYVFLPQSG